ncbi:MAG: DUF2312 domain-containing protein [Fibrobacter sp.]|nr:DUF2312 domain-containing protein [Fibrobacter sp.]
MAEIDASKLLSYVERVEHLNEEVKALQTDIKEIYEEAKSNGYDVKALKAIIALRKLDDAEREEAETVLDVYKAALGM